MFKIRKRALGTPESFYPTTACLQKCPLGAIHKAGLLINALVSIFLDRKIWEGPKIYDALRVGIKKTKTL